MADESKFIEGVANEGMLDVPHDVRPGMIWICADFFPEEGRVPIAIRELNGDMIGETVTVSQEGLLAAARLIIQRFGEN